MRENQFQKVASLLPSVRARAVRRFNLHPGEALHVTRRRGGER